MQTTANGTDMDSWYEVFMICKDQAYLASQGKWQHKDQNVEMFFIILPEGLVCNWAAKIWTQKVKLGI